MLAKSIEEYKNTNNNLVKEAVLKNIAYFQIALSLLTGETKGILPEVKDIVDKELYLIDKAEGRVKSNLFPFILDYTQFIPRGHYTRSDDWKKYFKGMMWYNQCLFPFYNEKGEVNDIQILQAQLITKDLFETKINGKYAILIWDLIYNITSLFSEESDFLTPYDYKKIMEDVYEKNIDINLLSDKTKLIEFVKKGEKFKEMKIKYVLVGVPSGPQFRFLGMRAVPDTEIMQKLVKFPVRRFAKGLDIFAAFGFNEAKDILINLYREDKNWEEYLPRLNEMNEKFAKIEDSKWQSNLYWGWLWVLKALDDTKGEGYPFFMITKAWEDKSLNTVCGSWAELRHDTILYSQTFGAEGGGDFQAPFPKGYVEPNVVFYERMLWIINKMESELSNYGLLSKNTKEKIIKFRNLVNNLKIISIKELTSQPLTEKEFEFINNYGRYIGEITVCCILNDSDDIHYIDSSWMLMSDIDKSMAVIADIGTSLTDCLEVGVGQAQEIYVIVPMDGKPQLTRGSTLLYYEFVHPINDRLTDEKWRNILSQNVTNPPEWILNFWVNEKKTEPKGYKKEWGRHRYGHYYFSSPQQEYK